MKDSSPETGSALIEILLLGLLLLGPLLWGLTVLAELHSAALAGAAAAREAGFDATRSADLAEAERRIDEAVAIAFSDNGLDPTRGEVEWTAVGGLERGARVEVRVEYAVPIFRAPFIGSISGPAISVSASHAARVPPYGSRER